MNRSEEFYANWIEALRSGNYPKSRGQLRTTSGFCCLGVACDLFDPNNWWFNSTRKAYLHAAEHHMLPNIVQTELNLRTHAGEFNPIDLPLHLQETIRKMQSERLFQPSLTAINDLTDDFSLIIEILEERPRSLFA